MNKENNSTVESSRLALVSQFKIKGRPLAISSFGSGHINDTYKISTDNGKGYILQRINHHVFKNIDHLMSNISLVTTHLHQKRTSANISDIDTVLTPVNTQDEKLYFQDDTGDYWRVYNLIDSAKSYDIVENDQQAKEVGRAFGKFQALLSDLEVNNLYEVIPNFCHIGSRLADFHIALENDAAKKRNRVKEEVNFIQEREKNMNAILEMAARNEIPLRVTHNDTKFNNVLLDRNDQAKCVIDLDTVMPGYIAYDYGDAIRTIINRAAEDEPNLEAITLNIPLFKAYTEGYFEQAREFLTVNEVRSLIKGVLLFPYMQAVRFLTDYLQGDTYYKIQHPEHNLQRTRAQLKLVAEIENHVDELEAIIEYAADKYPLKSI
jgi:Ser/Thr protein kinase RdoA (MazF antagonist)